MSLSVSVLSLCNALKSGRRTKIPGWKEVAYHLYTRDTFGIAVKATYAEDADGNPIMIFKNSKTDSGHFKKSQRGYCRVYKNYPNGDYHYEDGLTWTEAQKDNELLTVFKNGEFIRLYTLAEIRQNLYGGKF